MRIAFAGFQHLHIMAVYECCRNNPRIEIVAACEEDERYRASLPPSRKVAFTHTDIGEMLDTTDCDAVAIGTNYGDRGGIVLQALQQGRHVIADKPLCIRLDECEQIRQCAERNGLVVGCMLDLKDSPFALTMREAVRSGRIGEVRAVNFTAQHPLSLGVRPQWYFEEGKHGGTLNDIAIHAIDLIPWMTGLRITDLRAGYVWSTPRCRASSFQDGAQCLFSLENGAGVIGDVSYFAPEAFGYNHPPYWRVTVWGERGMLEGGAALPEVKLYSEQAESPVSIPLVSGNTSGFFNAFLAAVNGESPREYTEATLSAQRQSLELQALADTPSIYGQI